MVELLWMIQYIAKAVERICPRGIDENGSQLQSLVRHSNLGCTEYEAAATVIISWMRETRSAYKTWKVTLLKSDQLEHWEGDGGSDIKVYFREIRFEDVSWMDLA